MATFLVQLEVLEWRRIERVLAAATLLAQKADDGAYATALAGDSERNIAHANALAFDLNGLNEAIRRYTAGALA